MSDREEEELRPPSTPEQWKALTDEEDRVEENMENNDSDLEGSEKLRFRRLIAWQQIARSLGHGTFVSALRANNFCASEDSASFIYFTNEWMRTPLHLFMSQMSGQFNVNGPFTNTH